MTLDRKIEILSKPAWDYKDVMEYLNIKSPASAYKIMESARANGGAIKFKSNMVTSNSVLELYGTNRKQELEILKGETDEKELQEGNIQNT